MTKAKVITILTVASILLCSVYYQDMNSFELENEESTTSSSLISAVENDDVTNFDYHPENANIHKGTKNSHHSEEEDIIVYEGTELTDEIEEEEEIIQDEDTGETGEVIEEKVQTEIKYHQDSKETYEAPKEVETDHDDIPEESNEPKEPRKIFVDLGANCGNTYYKHREEHKEDADEWESYLWEPSPQMFEFYLDNLKEEYPDVHIVPYAAGVRDGDLKLYIHKGQENITDISQFKNHGRCGANVFTSPAGGTTTFEESGDAGEAVNIKVVNFPEWLKQLKITEEDSFILKVDIEGSEFEILDAMLNDENDNNLCMMDVLKVEFHPKLITKYHTEGLDEKFATFEEDFPELYKEKCGHDVNMELLN